MALSITTTWLPTVWGYRLDATGVVGIPTWYRSCYWPDGRFRNVNLGTGTPKNDPNIPLDGATVIYTAVDGADIAETTVYPTSVLPVLGLLDRVDVPAAQVVIESLREQAVQARTVYYDVLDRNDPFIQTMRPASRTGQMTLRVNHPDGRSFPGPMLDRMRKMLRTGEAMTLRTTCNERVEDLVFIFETWTEQQVGDGNHHGTDRKVLIDWRAVDPMWLDVSTSGRVWATVVKEFATWSDVVAQVPTWQALVDG